MAASVVNAENTVKKIYLTVIDEVMANIREAFLDEGCDEQLLQELRQTWESKLNASRALQSDEVSGDDAPASVISLTGSNSTSSSTNINNNTSTTSSSLRLPTVNANTNRPTPAPQQPGVVNINSMKQELDAATRSAFQALPHSIYSGKRPMNGNGNMAPQVDGKADAISSDEEDDIDEIDVIQGDDDEDDDVDDKNANDDQNSELEGKEDSDPLNSDDDLTDQESPDANSDLFDTDNVIVCQYDKITRIKNHWKFHLKDGIANINGRDFLFSKATGDAKW